MSVPRHVAIVMDGNGRWATRRGLPRLAGHKAGAERVRDVVELTPSLGVEYLTLFAFSTENWMRSRGEVNGLMMLFKHYMKSEAATLVRNGVRVRFIGERSRLEPDIQRQMQGLEEQTSNNSKLHLTLALNYGGRDEITRAMKRIAAKVKTGEIMPDDITQDVVSAHLDTAGLPDPDLIIRTSGELRTSGFLPWQSAYAEYVFPETLWPDFVPGEYVDIINSFGTRERRFGAVAG